MSEVAAPPPTRPETSTVGLTRSAGVVVAGAAITVVAVAARVYELRDVPRLTDETDEVMRGLQIARGELLPLTNVDAYIGPLWNYLVAVGFVMVGPGSMVPRVLTLAISLLTVLATMWLGHELAHRVGQGKLGGLVSGGSALLLAASAFHVIVSARIGWSHAMTPLWMTVAVAVLLRWERLQEGRLLAAGGLAYGLAVHTHPTAVAFAPGLLVWALLSWRGVLLSRAGWLAMALGLAVNAPMILFNVMSGFGSAAAAAQVQLAYAGGEVATASGFVRNLGALLGSLPLLLAGAVGERRGAMVTADGPIEAAVAVVAVCGLVLTCWRRVALPPLLLGSVCAVLPVVNGKYEPLFNGRYVAPLLPLGFALMALAVAYGVTWVADLIRRGNGSVAPKTVTILATWGVLTLLAVPSLISLQAYVAATLRDGPNNRELYRASEIVATTGSTRPILVDATLSGTRVSTGRDGTGVLEYLLILDARQAVRRLQPEQLVTAVERGEADLVIASPRLLTRLDKDFNIETPAGEAEARRARRAQFVLFRVLGKA